MTIHTSNFTCEWKPDDEWVDVTNYVMHVETDSSTTGSANGVAFGDSSDMTGSIRIDPNATTPELDLSTWELVPVRVSFTNDAHAARGLAGIIEDMDGDVATTTFRVTGYRALISKVRLYSPLFEQRPIATKTTAVSIEDPDSPYYTGGILNWIFWNADGRPYEQAEDYPDAVFYYSLDQALIAPDYSWVAGEDGWEQALQFVRAAGGQLYQRPDGVVAYVTPLSIAGGSSQFSLSPDDYNNPTRRGTSRDVVKSVRASFIPRYKYGLLEIVNDTKTRTVPVGATPTVIELETQYPFIASTLETATGGTQLLPEAISATFYDGRTPKQDVDYTHTIELAAQRVIISITNLAAQPFVIERIKLRACPIAPGEADTFVIGTEKPTLSLPDNPSIQSRGQAQRLARMVMAFYGTSRPIINVRDVLYDPTKHKLGYAGTLTEPRWSMTNVPVVILGVSVQESGAKCDLELVSTAGLPKLSDYFLWKTSSQAGLTKRIGY